MSPALLPHALLAAAGSERGERGLTFVDPSAGVDAPLSWRQLAVEAARVGATLRRAGVRQGSAVALSVATGPEFVRLFYGAMHIGAIPVPLYLPVSEKRLDLYLGNLRHILRISGAEALICPRAYAGLAESMLGRGLRILAAEDLEGGSEEAPIADIRPGDTAFLQFTSGSTSRPKGVVLTHQNLAENGHCIMHHGVRMGPDDVGCSWLPLYHDMGLIGFVLAPVLTSSDIVLLSPLDFLRRPLDWLRVMSRYRAAVSSMPNFGYGYCASRVSPEDIAGLDLSHWRWAGCAAEPIRVSTLRRFAQAFAPAGFQPSAFAPAYGMAEHTVAVTMCVGGAPPTEDVVSREALIADQRATPAASGVTHIGCGRAFPGHEIAIRRPDGAPCAEREVGEITLRGPSVMKEYIGDREATAAALRDGWLRSGDVGYLADGELFVCGRVKDVIVIAGRNFHPTDIEDLVSPLAAVRTGNVVAFGLPASDGEERERVVICAEIHGSGEPPAALQARIREIVLLSLGLRVDDVVLLPAGTLPKTSSGKLQRALSRKIYESGQWRPPIARPAEAHAPA